MITLFVRKGLLGDVVQRFDVELDGSTPRKLFESIAERMGDPPVQIAVDGKLCTSEDELDAELRDGQQVIVMPTTGGEGFVGFLVYVLVQLVIAVATYYTMQLLAPRPKAPGQDQERGDNSSQTYAWDGVKTNFGPGLPIPWGYGRHAVGGQVIWTDALATRPTGASALDDRLRLILSLCEGPIHRIGGRSGHVNDMGGFQGQTPQAGPPIPEDIYINGNRLAHTELLPGASVSIRIGTQDQPALLAPFTGISETFSPLADLSTRDSSSIFTFGEAAELSNISVVLYFPSGLYVQSTTTGQPQALLLTFGVFWRPLGFTAGWLPIGAGITQPGAAGPYVGAYAHTFTGTPTTTIIGPTGTMTVPFVGPIEIMVQRGGGVIQTNWVSQCVWRDLVVRRPHTLRYPLEALMALEIQAGARFSGGLPNITVPCDLSLVRVWDAVNGWSPFCWDVPAAPFNFHTYPPGRNPAWCLLHFLLSRYGLGSYLTEADLDLPSFRRWAIFCDQDPNPSVPWGEPQFTVDMIGDQPRPAWDWVLAFCAAGRATPVQRGGKIGVVYQYRDAHSDAGVSVPAKVATQLITSGNCEQVQVRWLPTANRPTLYQFQFLDEARNWAQDVLPVEDDGGSLNDPAIVGKDEYRPEIIQAYGVTRASQLFREGRWRHRITRLVRRELAFVTGPWALAAEVGDLIDFEHEVLRPFSTDTPLAMQVLACGALPTTSVTIDHELSGSGLQIVVRDPNGKPHKANISSFANSEGTSVLVLATGVNVKVGATCVVGKIDKLTETYEIAACTLTQNLKREVKALQWTPTAYDPILESDFLEGGTDDVIDAPTFETLPPSVYGIAVVRLADKTDLATWARQGPKVGSDATVYVRELPDGVWVHVGTTDASEIVLRGLIPGVAMQIAVCLENTQGVAVPPDLGDLHEFTVEEFPRWQPPNMTNIRATVLDAALQVEADELGQEDLDYFELATGSSWAAREVLRRERAPRFQLLSPPGGSPLMVAARARSGLYGRVTSIANPGWLPPYTAQVLNENDLAPSPAGTHTGTNWNSTLGVIELNATTFAGTYESLAQDVGYQAPIYWQVQVDRVEVEDVTIAELPFLVGSGEARWRTIEGRPASAGNPGIDWSTRISDLAMPIEDLPGTMLVGGHVGEVGSHTLILVESRFEVSGSWTAYKPHVDRTVVARKIQVRLTFARRALHYKARARLLTYNGFL